MYFHEVSTASWKLPEQWERYDASLCAAMLSSVERSLPWLEMDEQLYVATRAAESIGRLTAAWESGFVKSVDTQFVIAGYMLNVMLPDLSSQRES